MCTCVGVDDAKKHGHGYKAREDMARMSHQMGGKLLRKGGN